MENSSKKTTKKEDHKNNKRIPSKKVIFKREKELITQHIFPIVAVGGSAGGLEAFKKLIEKLPVDIGMAFVFIAHLDPNSPSNLKQILQYSTSLAVAVIEDSQQITPNTIYVLPPNTFVTMFNNKLKLSPRPSNKRLFLPIDIFLTSLAEEKKNNAIAIILSGLGADGAAGVKAINENGGLIFVQDTKSANYESMPTHAIATGFAHFILNPEKMAEELIKLGKHPFIGEKEEDPIVENNGINLQKIIYLVKNRCGIDFSHYKKQPLTGGFLGE